MMTNKTPALLALTFFALVTINAAQAQDPASQPTQTVSPVKLALIKELLELTNSKKTMDTMLKAQAEQMDKQMPDMIWQIVSNMKELQALTAAQREEIRAELTETSLRSGRRIYEVLLEKIDFNKVVEDISVPIYDKYFSESELSDLVAFNKSATGKKILEVMPNLVSESMTRASEVILPKVSEVITQLQAEETERIEKEIKAKTSEISKRPVKKPVRRRARS
ncbi:MAG: DUF2059 domain-containing protein [bacterium]